MLNIVRSFALEGLADPAIALLIKQSFTRSLQMMSGKLIHATSRKKHNCLLTKTAIMGPTLDVPRKLNIVPCDNFPLPPCWH